MRNFIAWSKDEDNLLASSSGGIFLELAKETLKRKGRIVGVVMPGLVPFYTFTENINLVKAMRGSKYLRARLGRWVLEAMKNFKGQILFVGLPCAIEMMKNIFKDRRNILYVELRCHGVIKKDIFEKYTKHALVVKFRDKSNGWRGSTKLCVDGKCRKNKLIKDYIQGNNIEEICKKCKLHSQGNIILADYWECPPYLENKKGTSKVITIDDQGQEFFDSLDNIERKEHCPNKIAIMGGMTVSNNGTLIMTQNFIEYMLQKADVEFTLLEYEKGDTGKEVMERILPKSITNKIDYGFHSAWDLLDGHKLLGYIKSIKWIDQSNLEKQIRDCETVVYLGGDHFVGKAILRNRMLWFMRMLFTFWDFRNIKRAGKKLYLVSQTMGQLPWYTNLFAKWAFSKADGIYCRDDFSMKEMRKLGLKNIHRCYDLAFLPLYNESSCKIEHKSKYTVLVVSDLWRKYCDTKDEFIDKLAYIANALNKVTKLPVYLMAHSDNQNMNYCVGEGLLIKKIECRAQNKHVSILPNATPIMQRQILGGSQLNVSLRMHASISSLEQGTPVIPIAYSAKFKAMYSDLQLEDLVVERLNTFEVADKIEEVWHYRAFIKFDIVNKLEHNNIQKLALKPIMEIAENVQ